MCTSEGYDVINVRCYEIEIWECNLCTNKGYDVMSVKWQ